mmetsp:Transcript_12942/g.29312  ORF Transcript_12942/g.29312 Transcript_12942/m.29312 type:complete len:207 (-) Transcript_12942:1101-1721(-)
MISLRLDESLYAIHLPRNMSQSNLDFGHVNTSSRAMEMMETRGKFLNFHTPVAIIVKQCKQRLRPMCMDVNTELRQKQLNPHLAHCFHELLFVQAAILLFVHRLKHSSNLRDPSLPCLQFMKHHRVLIALRHLSSILYENTSHDVEQAYLGESYEQAKEQAIEMVQRKEWIRSFTPIEAIRRTSVNSVCSAPHVAIELQYLALILG